MQSLNALVDKNKVYGVDEAIDLAKKTSNVKFDATVEVHAKLGIDPSKSDQQIRATVVLPNSSGKVKTVAAFVSTNNEKTAKEAGADFVYGEEDIKKIKDSGKVEFEVAVATPDMMPKLAVAAKVLGPKGLMPNPKTDTVGTDLKKMIGELKKGKVTFKNDDGANIHMVLGKVSLDNVKLKENFNVFYEALKKAKPNSTKGTYIKTLFLTSSMGPSIRTEISQ